ncbi:MAG: hypothetical protein BWY81_00503 [Firmicutes bacterium ADurb.Bin467]|nr:MAG: hypothetical protein BWY81_00503 [Firmicutes bacterium ADurb.Bin467]
MLSSASEERSAKVCHCTFASARHVAIRSFAPSWNACSFGLPVGTVRRAITSPANSRSVTAVHTALPPAPQRSLRFQIRNSPTGHRRIATKSVTSR